MNAITKTDLPRRSLVDSMAARYDMEPSAFVSAIKATVIKGDVSNEQFAAFLMVAKEYDLNPLLKEIYAFPANGGIQPIVSIDGWMKLINSHPEFDGMEFNDTHDDDGKLYSVECRMYRKDRTRPICVIEYMSECFRQTPTWKQWPTRMLRHKAAIQAARYAFGFSEIMEPDEYERMRDVTPEQPSVMTRLQSRQETPQAREGFDPAHIASETAALTGEPASGQSKDISQSSGPSADDGSDGEALSPGQTVAADPSHGDEGAQAGQDGEPASSSDQTGEERAWLIKAAKMLIGAAVPGGDPDIVRRQYAALIKNETPASISQDAIAKANAIGKRMVAVCESTEELDLDLIAGLARCDVAELRT